MVNASLMICGATWVAFCGSPSVSNVFNCTWQPGLAALCLSTASWMPFLMLMPSAASGPLSAPAMARDTGGHCALPSPAGSGGVAAFGRLDLRTVLVDLHLLDDLQIRLRRAALIGRLGLLLAAGNAEHNQTRATDSKCIPCHATAHVSPPGRCFHRRRRPSPGRRGRRCFGTTIANAWPWCVMLEKGPCRSGTRSGQTAASETQN